MCDQFSRGRISTSRSMARVAASPVSNALRSSGEMSSGQEMRRCRQRRLHKHRGGVMEVVAAFRVGAGYARFPLPVNA